MSPLGNRLIRALGVLLLVIGLGWTCVQQINILMRVGTRSALEAQYGTLNPDPGYLYTADEVRKHMGETAIAMFRIFPSPLHPVAFILAGVVLLAFSQRPPPAASN